VEGDGHTLLRLDSPRLGRLTQFCLLFQELVDVLIHLLVIVFSTVCLSNKWISQNMSFPRSGHSSETWEEEATNISVEGIHEGLVIQGLRGKTSRLEHNFHHPGIPIRRGHQLILINLRHGNVVLDQGLKREKGERD